MGKKLLQDLMAASIETLEDKLAAYTRQKTNINYQGESSKSSLPSNLYLIFCPESSDSPGEITRRPYQYTFRIDPSDNQRKRENVHHKGRWVHFVPFHLLFRRF